jgi:hypothetical protein
MKYPIHHESNRRALERLRGIALVPVMLIVSGLAIFTAAMMTATLSGNRSLLHQSDDYKLASAVETASTLAMEDLWSDYLRYVAANNNGRRTIGAFRTFMTIQGFTDESDTFDADDDGVVELVPTPQHGTNLIGATNLPVHKGKTQINNVNIDAIQLVRVDVTADATQLFLTISSSTTRGDGIVNPILNRAVQQVYTVEPDDFDGFEYAILANNVNCVFCHTNVDSAERWFNTDPANHNSFDRVKVGALETLLLRHDMDGDTTKVNHFDADSFVAGTVYSRGIAVQHDGTTVSNWGDMSFMGYEFDPDGKILEDSWGNLTTNPFAPAGTPPVPGENLYLEYADLGEQVDGPLPDYFPAPIPDDGGIDPATGLPDPGAAGNRQIDDFEFDKVAGRAKGAITAGVVDVSDPSTQISTIPEYSAAVFVGNTPSIHESATGNVILTGSETNPIQIDGTIAIDGDLIIQGYIRGEGALIVRGNVYIPTDLVYADEKVHLPGDPQGSPSGRLFGQYGGQSNALGLMAGGNIIIGDFQRPAGLKPNFVYTEPGLLDIVTGNPDPLDPDAGWSFPLAEMALFNRGEWARTQEYLPGMGDDITNPATWTALNPNYDPNHVPRYYGFGDDTLIPIHNRSLSTTPNPLAPNAPYLYFDPALNSWIGDEASLAWDPNKLSYADPTDASDPFLFDNTGNPIAVTSSLMHKDDWIAPLLYQQALEYFNANRGPLTDHPMNIDGLLYTNNAIFSMVNRTSPFEGRMTANGSIVAADLGMLVPGNKKNLTTPFSNLSPLSGYSIGLQLNYDKRVKDLLNVVNPLRVKLKRTLWNPTSNIL